MEAANYFETLMDMQHSNLRHIQQDLYFRYCSLFCYFVCVC